MITAEFKLVENQAELEGALAVRNRVFVQEQQIPAEEEIDAADGSAVHAIAMADGIVIGAGRLVLQGDGSGKIGRMAVDREHRRKGIGGRILELLECEGRVRGCAVATLHAQEYIKDFYCRRGYSEFGEPFLEVDIPHVAMRKTLRDE